MTIENENRSTVGFQDLQIITADTETIDFDASAQSTAFNRSIIRVHSTEDVWLKFGSDPTAVAKAAGNILVPADTTEYFRVKLGEKVAAIKNATGGYINIAGCY